MSDRTEDARVLIVDDDADVLETLKEELSDEYDVTPSVSGEAACLLLDQVDFAAVISDVRMPGMDGVELLRRVKLKNSDTIRILLTGYSDETALGAAMTPGGAYKLSKPWGDELLITLRRALEHRRALHAAAAESAREHSGRLRAELAVHNLDKMASLGCLAAGVVHELRSPLASLTINLQMLRSDVSEIVPAIEHMARVGPPPGIFFPEDVGAFIDDIRDMLSESHDSALRIADVLKGIGSYSASRGMERFDASLGEPIDYALSMVNHTFQHRVEAHLDLADTDRLVYGNVAEISQVVMNLVLNSVQAMAEQGHVFIRSRQEGARVIVEVEDTGPGVASEHRSKIFDLFFSTRPGNEPSGMGLSIAREIVARHGGKLTCIGTRSRGAIFAFNLPTIGAEESDVELISH